MSKQACIVTGLGYGDEGKGTSTHWLADHMKAHTVIRIGGPQALHRVVTAKGENHVFSQFGSGTFTGAATHLSRDMVIDPYALLREGDYLKYAKGISFIFDILTVHEDALVITPFHAITGRLRELLRGKNRYGSVGIGVGETVCDAENYPDDAVRAKDCAHPFLREKLKRIRARKLMEFEEVRDRAAVIPQEVEQDVRRELRELEDPDTIEWALEHFTEFTRRIKIVSTGYVRRTIMKKEGTLIIESSQGVLLDRWYGFHPYTTKVPLLPDVAYQLLEGYDYAGTIRSIGVLRAYATRHGAGPFVTESPLLTAQLPDETNTTHAWQGTFRVGAFDAVLARYALAVVKRNPFGGLLLTCVDRVSQGGLWDVCHSYQCSALSSCDTSLFHCDLNNLTDIAVGERVDSTLFLKRQERIGVLLGHCKPRNTSYEIPSEKRGATRLCVSTLEEILNVPVVACSFGPTEQDKRLVKQYVTK
ncbi:MAG: adenylosuccinate synthetase [Patescibacteria group bacterium]|nr:adenylosuccinate synthetase [Patescibacteria group bacterium]MDE2437958.1 adenylosuccinate synthetase [Patescibacteria group bacterium]